MPATTTPTTDASEPATPRADAAATALADYLYDIGPAGIVLYEPEPPFRVLATNKAYQDLWPEPLRSRGLAGVPLADYVPGAEEAGIASVFREVARTGVARNIEEFPFDGFPGGTRWFNWTLAPVVRQKRIVALAHMAVDITREVLARREAERAAAESCHAAELLDLGDPFCELDRDFRIIRVNAAHERINRHRREQILGRTHWEVWPESALPSSPYWREYHRCVAERVRVEFDAYYAPLDVWTSVIAYPTAQGGVAISWRDASERKRAEAALRDSEEKLRVSFAQATIGFALTTPEGRFLDVNPAYCAITGYTPDELRSMAFSELIDPDDLASNFAQFQRMLAGDLPAFVVENRYRRKQGDSVWVRKSVSLVRSAAGEPQWMIALVEDVTARKCAEAALRQTEQRLRTVVDNSRDGINMLDVATGRYLFMSQAQVAMTGFTEDELAGMTAEAVHERVHPDDRGISVQQHQAIVEGREPSSTVVYRWKVKSGEYRWFSDSRRLVRDEKGRAIALVGVSRDVTEQKRAEEALRESETRYRTLFNAVDEGFFIIDVIFDDRDRPVDMLYVAANAAATRMLGRDYTGKRLRELDPQYEQHWYEIFGKVALTGESVRMEQYAEPDKKWYSFYVFRLGGPEHRRIGNLFQDITERKRAEEALREANEQLREADRRKDDFLGMLSHELRNPLAPIRNSVYLMERTAPDSEAARRGRAVIRRQTEHLARLVDDLLDITRISRAKIELHRERLDAREVVRKITEDLHGLFEQAGIELRVEHMGFTPIWVDVDPMRLSQVIGNLLQNAAKFTAKGGAVTVSLTSGQGWAELRVRDSGAGMDPAQVQRMFEPFVQAEQSLARSKGGLGLGLALVKGLVEQHGGTVEGRSEGVGRGAEFVIRLPLAPPAPADGAGQARAPTARRRIVIIEDNVDAAETLAELLVLEGHEVSTVRDAKSGIALVRQQVPDVVLCDLGLPDADGYDVARELRRDEALQRVRLIALSGYAQPEDRDRARAAGFDGHIAKPPDLNELGRLLAAD